MQIVFVKGLNETAWGALTDQLCLFVQIYTLWLVSVLNYVQCCCCCRLWTL